MTHERNNGRGDDHRRPVTTVKRSGIEILDQIYDLEKDGPAFGMGHYIPDIWTRVFLDERGRPHWLAMMVFAEVWFRHRPRQYLQIRDNGDKVITLSKGFTEDRYQFNRAELAHRLNTSEDAISRVLTYLVKLGVIDRQHEDTDINHRGFRNLVYVTPKVERLLELIGEAREIVNKDTPDREHADDTERRDVGNVPHITPATLPSSSRQRGPHDVGDVGRLMGGVSKESSERSSASAVFAAAPQKPLEANINNKSSAPQAAQAGGGDAPAAHYDWEAPPPNRTGPNGRFGNQDEKVKAIRHRIGKSYLTWFGQMPDMPAAEFEQQLLAVDQELSWKWLDVVMVIQAGWLWALDAPKKEPGETFIPAFFSRACDGNLRALFKRDRKGKKLFIWHIREELSNQARNEYQIDLGRMTREEADAWWDQEMLDRKVVRDESKFYDQSGREIYDPAQTTWTGIRRVLEAWISFNRADKEPEPKWIAAVIERMKRDSGRPIPHPDDYEESKKLLAAAKLLPCDE